MTHLLDLRGRWVIGAGVLLIAIIAVADWKIEFNATLGFLYIFPLALLGTALRKWQLVAIALFCTFLSDRLDPFPMDVQEARDALIFLSLVTTGLLANAFTKSYRAEREGRTRLEEEVLARRAAESQLTFLIETSPAAILTANAEGEILLANPAAHRLLASPQGTLPGKKIGRYIDALGSIPAIAESDRIFRTEMHTRGRTDRGDVFVADVFFSTYATPAGPRLAALIVDKSENLREREEASLQQLLDGSRILVAAVSHEVRNVCGAIGMMHENLARSGKLEGDQDFEALGSLVETLKKIASLELKQSVGAQEPAVADLNEVLTDLRIILQPVCEESEIELEWNVAEGLPFVQADHHMLLQVLLNLARNSQRALASVREKRIELTAVTTPEGVAIRFGDNGPGIPAGQKLFQPLQKGAEATGLGLYVSRAFMRSFRGELRHEPERPGCSFVLELLAAAGQSWTETVQEADGPHTTAGSR